MNKIILSLFLIFSSVVATAQDEDLTDSQQRMEKFNSVKKHEVSLDVAAAIAGLGINPRYEYVLGRHSGVGVDLNISIANDDDFDNVEKFSITPYYRQYFFSKEDYGAKGFYGEGFLKVHSFEDDLYFSNGSGPNTKTYTDVALGVGIGWKWVSDSGFLIDVGFGIGRNLGLPDEPVDNYLPAVVGRGGVNFGWRF